MPQTLKRWGAGVCRDSEEPRRGARAARVRLEMWGGVRAGAGERLPPETRVCACASLAVTALQPHTGPPIPMPGSFKNDC